MWQASQWFDRYFLLLVIVFCLPVGVVTALVRMRKGQDDNHVVGLVLTTTGAAFSVLLSIQLFFPFIARACWGIGEAHIPLAPTCAPATKNCTASVSCADFQVFLKAYFRAAVPAATGLLLATLGALLAAVIWFVSAMKKVFKT